MSGKLEKNESVDLFARFREHGVAYITKQIANNRLDLAEGWIRRFCAQYHSGDKQLASDVFVSIEYGYLLLLLKHARVKAVIDRIQSYPIHYPRSFLRWVLPLVQKITVIVDDLSVRDHLWHAVESFLARHRGASTFFWGIQYAQIKIERAANYLQMSKREKVPSNPAYATLLEAIKQLSKIPLPANVSTQPETKQFIHAFCQHLISPLLCIMPMIMDMDVAEKKYLLKLGYVVQRTLHGQKLDDDLLHELLVSWKHAQFQGQDASMVAIVNDCLSQVLPGLINNQFQYSHGARQLATCLRQIVTFSRQAAQHPAKNYVEDPRLIIYAIARAGKLNSEKMPKDKHLASRLFDKLYCVKNEKVTPLIFAVKQNKLTIVQQLLDYVDPNRVDSDEHTPLYYAMLSHNDQMIRTLLLNGAKLTDQEMSFLETQARLNQEYQMGAEVDCIQRLFVSSEKHNQAPLFLFHDITGSISSYDKLVAQLKKDGRPIYGVMSLSLKGGGFPDSLQEMVENYTKAIQQRQPTGPYLLAGWSFGGLLAVEVASRLLAQGEKVNFVGVVDTVSPRPHLLNHADLKSNAERVIDNIFKAYGYHGFTLNDDFVSSAKESPQCLIQRIFGKALSLLMRDNPEKALQKIQLILQTSSLNMQAMVRHQSEPHPALRLTCFSSQETMRASHLACDLGWYDLVLEPVDGIPIGHSDHFSLLQNSSQVEKISEVMRCRLNDPSSTRACDAESGSTGSLRGMHSSPRRSSRLKKRVTQPRQSRLFSGGADDSDETLSDEYAYILMQNKGVKRKLLKAVSEDAGELLEPKQQRCAR